VITEAEVSHGKIAKIGDRVKHFGQRYTGCATATIVGFERMEGHYWRGKQWVKVVVEIDPKDSGMYGTRWDWDRTELVPGPEEL
jgi:hypothetical protein